MVQPAAWFSFTDIPTMSDVTRILQSIEAGDPQPAEELLPLVYDELRKLAAAKMAQENPDQSLSATALVHEAYVRLVDVEKARHWNSRGHFFAAAGEAMRRILVERARAKQRRKRAGKPKRLDVNDVQPAKESDPALVLAINDALDQLATEDERLAALVKLRCFVGFTLLEAADALGIGQSVAYEDWAYAKSRLRILLNPAD
jgi:RNA polymerase sigma factor (TIGR02999 family)